MCRLTDHRVLATSAEQRRLLARVVNHHTLKLSLLAFAAADTHLHIELAESRAVCGETARRIQLALRYRLRLPVSFQRAHLKPITDQQHLANLFDYILKQQDRHGLHSDPWHEATNLPELLGLRVLPSSSVTTVAALLPRINQQQLQRYFELSPLSLARFSSKTDAAGTTAQQPERPLLMTNLGQAALRATGHRSLDGTSRSHLAMRRALVAIAPTCSPSATLASLMGVAPRSVRRYRRQRADARLVRAIRLQLELQRQLESQQSQRDVESGNEAAATG